MAESWKRSANGFVSMLHVTMLHPRFGGPTRTILESKEPIQPVIETTRDLLTPAFWAAIQNARPRER